MENRVVIRRPGILQRRLAEAGRRSQGRNYGNDAVEAVYPMTKTLANGDILDGSKSKYTVTFAASQFPPVDASGSVTMYDGKSQLLIENPINRYLINSPDAARHEEECGRLLSRCIFRKTSPGGRPGIQLAAGAERPDLTCDAALLAEDRSAVRPASG